MGSTERPYRTLRELVHAHYGMPAVVMGGGPSLPSELERCPGRDQAIYISANDHGAKLCGCDYIVAHDKIEERLRPFGVPIVSRHLFADIRYVTFPAANSGVIAAWFAAMLGCAPIHTTGMDCWTGGTYWHDPEAKSAGHLLSLSDHLSRWERLMRTVPAAWKPMGPVLADALKRWNAWLPGPVARNVCIAQVSGVFVRFTRTVSVKWRTFWAGETYEVTEREARHFVAERSAVALSAAGSQMPEDSTQRLSLAYRKNTDAIWRGIVPEKYRRLLPFVHGGTVLEIGAAEGVFSLLLARERRVTHVTALELRPERHEEALALQARWRELGYPVDACEMVCGDIRNDLGRLAGVETLVAIRAIYYLRDDATRVLAAAAEAGVGRIVLCGNRNRHARYLANPDGEQFNELAAIPGMCRVLDAAGYVIETIVEEGDPIVVGHRSG